MPLFAPPVTVREGSMKPVPNDTLLAQLKWRYACKKFDPARAIPAADWETLAQALVLAPSSYGLQPWKFFAVTDPAVKAKLPAISWGQGQPQDCSHMVVLAVRKPVTPADIDRLIARIVEVRGVTAESLAGYKKMMLGSHQRTTPEQLDAWMTHQVYIALGQFMASAALLGIDTCPMEGIQPADYDALLGLPAQGYHAVVGCAAGYRAADDAYAQAAKVRFKTEEVVQVI